MSKFKDYFSEWVMFDDGHTFVISAEAFTKEQAILELKKDILTWSKYQAVRVFEDDLQEDRVRFCIKADSDYYDQDKKGFTPAWWLGSKGKGSKKVWVLNMWNVSNFTAKNHH